jgi:hypothetical protein
MWLKPENSLILEIRWMNPTVIARVKTFKIRIRIRQLWNYIADVFKQHCRQIYPALPSDLSSIAVGFIQHCRWIYPTDYETNKEEGFSHIKVLFL